MKIIGLFMVIALLFPGCASLEEMPQEFWVSQLEIDPFVGELPTPVSLIRLISNPEDFHGRYIRVVGFLRREFERNKLFLRKEDCDQWLESNSINIGIAKEEMEERMNDLSGNYVLMEGTFYYRKGDWGGTIWRITRVERNLTPELFLHSLDTTEPNR